MSTAENKNEVFKQNLDTKGEFQHIFQIHLLFKERENRPQGKVIQEALNARFGKTDIVADVKESLSTFAVWKFLVEYKDNQKVPAQVLMSDFENFDAGTIDQMQRSQLWDCPNNEEILATCKYKLMLSDFLASGLEYKERCELLTGWLETTLELFPDCIAVWVPFNEAWGQFKTPEIVAWTKEYDPSRLVNPASGGNHYTCGDILDLHHYPGPNMFLYDPRRATVLGEYGGIGLVIEGNTWVNDKKNWGYVKFNTSDEVTNEYIKYGKHLLELIQKGFSAAVYTQTTDVEGEINGLMTYDRKVIKMNEAKVREINQQICNSLNK